jgi:drug/metabolite transporter, DME family
VLIYLGVVPNALAYAFFFTGIKTVPGAVASIVTLVEPLTATALATAFLGERLAPVALSGGLLVLAAVAGLYLHRLRQGSRTARTARWTASEERSPSAATALPADS